MSNIKHRKWLILELYYEFNLIILDKYLPAFVVPLAATVMALRAGRIGSVHHLVLPETCRTLAAFKNPKICRI